MRASARVSPPHDSANQPCLCIATTEAPVLLFYFQQHWQHWALASPQHGCDLCSQMKALRHSVVSVGRWVVVVPQHPEFARNRGLRREDSLYRCSSTSCPCVSACSLWKFHPLQPAEAKHEAYKKKKFPTLCIISKTHSAVKAEDFKNLTPTGQNDRAC